VSGHRNYYPECCVAGVLNAFLALGRLGAREFSAAVADNHFAKFLSGRSEKLHVWGKISIPFEIFTGSRRGFSSGSSRYFRRPSEVGSSGN
jgi:hypothetical protein